jgi:hypothetical protein
MILVGCAVLALTGGLAAPVSAAKAAERLTGGTLFSTDIQAAQGKFR